LPLDVREIEPMSLISLQNNYLITIAREELPPAAVPLS
jgi:hypothetical protein